MPQPSNPAMHGAPRKLLFVRQRFSQFGGGERILDRTITAMRARGLGVALMGRSWAGGEEVEFIRCDPSRFPRFRRERNFARAACARIAREPATLVQSHERIPCCDIFRAGDGLHAAFVAHRARGMNALAGRLLALHPFHRSVIALEREMFASPRLKAVIANSQMVTEEIMRFYGFPRERIHLVPNGINLAHFHPGARARHRAEIRNRLGTDEQRPVALFVGSGFKRKGLGVAIAAVRKADANAELWAVGHDRRPSAYSAPRLRMIGPVPDPLPYYAAADMLILPSIYDPFPSTVIEALACGLPAVTSTGCGARDAAAQLDPALVCDAFDTDALAEAARRAFMLAADPATVEKARAIANAYDMQTMIDRMLAVYAALGMHA